MNRQVSKRVAGKLIAAAVGAVGLTGIGASQADASLVIDVSATAVTGGASLDSAKQVTFSAPGQTVTLTLTAQIRGTNTASEETLQSAQGSIRSTGPLLGNLSFGATRDDVAGPVDTNSPGNIVNSNLVDPFDGNGSSDGQFIDLDGDGDIDVGSTGSDASLYFVARAPTAGGGTNIGAGSPGAGDNRIIGRVKYTYTGGSGSSLANFLVRLDATNAPFFSAAVWTEDGVAKSPTTGVYGQGSPVLLTTGDVPEPTGLALAGLGAIGLVARRRSKSN